MNLVPPSNKNYAAVVVALDRFVDLPNCDNVKAAIIFNNSVIVSKTAQPGEVGIFFPVECRISNEFLGANNQFRKPEDGNADATKKGFFEAHGRVKAMKFRGHKSEGFWIPLNSLNYLGFDPYRELNPGDEFEAIDVDGVKHEIAKKYVPKQNPASLRAQKPRAAKIEDKIVDGQFRLHYDTTNLRRNIHNINPSDIISISEKWHGTSAVVGNLKIKRDLKWYEKALKKMRVKIQESQYGPVWSSRRVIKGVEEPKEGSVHFYESDVWGDVAKEVYPLLPKGFTVYGEIVGYTKEGSPIQSLKGEHYHYGCTPGQHRFLVYRATLTNEEGQVTELSWQQMKEFCYKLGLETVRPIYYGKAGELFQELDFLPPFADPDNYFTWRQDFLTLLEKNFAQDIMCRHNDFKVPAEGVVIRKDHLENSEAWKLKSFLFLQKESEALDTGAVDMETAESEGASAN